MQQVRLPLGSTVIILKKMQGGVWREAGRTGVCPTPEWLLDTHGVGEFELRLKQGNRVLCMVGVNTSKLTAQSAERQVQGSGPLQLAL